MTREGAMSERLKRATEALEAEMEEWRQLGLTPNGWRMGDSEIMFLCQLNAIYEILKEKLEISDDEFNAKLREVTLKQFQQLRERVSKEKSDALLRKLTEGINFRPPPDIMNGGQK